MSINNIDLSAEQLAALYPESLVMDRETGKPEPGSKKITEPEKKTDSKTGKKAGSRETDVYRFLGNNLRRICFIVSYPETVFLPDEQLAFLTRMLSACHCSIADVSVLNAAHTPVDITKLITQLNPGMLFLCGIPPASLNLPEPVEPFTICRFNGISTLLIPSLTLLSQEETADLIPIKKKLWSSLRTLFNIQS
ncbi:MAG: hypothetical protein ACHQDF_02260 [Chitinophagales bacterium]